MSREDAKVVVNSFQGGLVTEASALNSPEGTMSEAMNVRLLRDGSIMKRPGLQVKTTVPLVDNGLLSSGSAVAGFQLFDWPQQSAKVIRSGSYLIYHKTNKTTGAVTHITSDLSSVQLPAGTQVSIAFSKDRIFISSLFGEVSRLVWGAPTFNAGGEFTAFPTTWEDFEPRIRDFSGVENLFTDTFGTYTPGAGNGLGDVVTLPDDVRRDTETFLGDDWVKKTQLSHHQYYNLRNAGWVEDTQCVHTEGGGSPRVVDPVFACCGWSTDGVAFPTTGAYFIPSRSEHMSLGKLSTASSAEALDSFSRWAQRKAIPSTLITGSTIGRLFNMEEAIKVAATPKEDSIRLPDNSNTLVELDLQTEWDAFPYFALRRKATAVGYAFGRVWIGGINVDGIENNVGYSKVLQDSAVDATKFYQENNPTDPEVNQLLDTDGGLLTLEGAGDIYEFAQFRRSLLIFAENGVWSITGSDGSSFKATDFTITKISSVGCLGAGYSVEGPEGLYYLNRTAVHLLAENQYGLLDAVDISTAAIQSKVSGLLKNKYNNEGCQLSYDPLNSRLHINFKDYYREVNGQHVSYCDLRRSLIFDTVTKAWTERKRGSVSEALAPVYDAFGVKIRPANTEFYGPCFHSASFTSDQNDGDNMVYISTSNVTSDEALHLCTEDSSSHADLTTGLYTSAARINPVVLTDPLTDKQISYLEIYSENPKVIDAAACTVNTNYSWSAEPTGIPFEAIRYEHFPVQVHHADNDVIVAKDKIHGRGKAVDISFTNNETDKTFKILGYAFTYNYNTRP